MSSILLLHAGDTTDSKVKDYLGLSGYEVQELQLWEVDQREHVFAAVNLILIECKNPNECIPTCRWIRGETNLPLIILSPCDEEWEKIKMFQLGVDDYITVPYRQAELVARVHANIERYRRLTRPFGIIKVRDLVINALNRQVLVSGEEIPLRLKEFDVLLYMAQHPNQVISRDEIYQAVWDSKNFVGAYENSVTVHVKRIRKKIEKNPDTPQYIETVWGIGYRFLD